MDRSGMPSHHGVERPTPDGRDYPADVMPEDNEELVAQTEEFGFRWFRRFEPRE